MSFFETILCFFLLEISKLMILVIVRFRKKMSGSLIFMRKIFRGQTSKKTDQLSFKTIDIIMSMFKTIEIIMSMFKTSISRFKTFGRCRTPPEIFSADRVSVSTATSCEEIVSGLQRRRRVNKSTSLTFIFEKKNATKSLAEG